MPISDADITQHVKDYAFVTNACVAVPGCVGIVGTALFPLCDVVAHKRFHFQTTWGITDSYSWIPETFAGQGYGLLWDGKYISKCAFEVLIVL